MLLDFTNPRLPVGVRADKVFGSMNTPNSVASNMVNMTWENIKDDIDKDWVFLNVCCKTGVFPTNLFDKLVTCKNLVKAFPNYYERRHWILENMIKCISTNQTSKEFSGLYLYGLDYIVYEHNIKVIPENEVCAYLRKLKGENMRFDIVIGNPPYNNDIYLDFVTAGHELASKFSCWITPAKWQAKGGQKNEDFREKIVPYMKEIVYYPCAQELFDIRNLDGISYYLIDKNTYAKHLIINKSKRIMSFNNELEREYLNQLNNCAYNIVNKVKNYNKLKIAVADWSPFGVKSEAHSKNNTVGVAVSNVPDEICVKSGDRTRGYCKKKDIIKNCHLVGKWMLISNGMNGNCYYTEDGTNLGMNKTYILKPNEVACEPYIVIGVADTENEIKSLDSYIWCKFTRFLMVTGIVGQGTADLEMWRFIPDPGKFDHIFTDEELYTKYNLTQEEINIIESVIKERK